MRRTGPVVLILALLAGCSSSPGGRPTTAGCSSPASGTVTVTAALRDGRADPAPHRVTVALNSPVVVRVETDDQTEVHVHGYDREAEAAPDSPGCVAFVADRPGVFDVEAHPETLLVQLEVR